MWSDFSFVTTGSFLKSLVLFHMPNHSVVHGGFFI